MKVLGLYSLICNVLGITFIIASKSQHLKFKFFATTTNGLEKVLSSEIHKLPDVRNVAVRKGGVEYEGSLLTGASSIMKLRTAIKVMELLKTGTKVLDKNDLYKLCTNIEWCSMMNHKTTIKCSATLGSDIPVGLNHQFYTSLTLKNAIFDHFRFKESQETLTVELDNPDLPLHLYLNSDRVYIYRVWSGESSMHKRGYRTEVIHKAALRETTAAAIISKVIEEKGFLDNIKESKPILCDPMCGSGSIVIEAALMLADCDPGLIRYNRSTIPTPGSWLDIQQEFIQTWGDVFEESSKRDKRALISASIQNKVRVPPILANDIHKGAIELAIRSAANAKVHRMIDFNCRDIIDYFPHSQPSLIITNPPWNLRLNDGSDDSTDEELENVWMKLGKFVQRIANSTTTTGITPVNKGVGTDLWVLTMKDEAIEVLNRFNVLPKKGIQFQVSQNLVKLIQFTTSDSSAGFNHR